MSPYHRRHYQCQCMEYESATAYVITVCMILYWPQHHVLPFEKFNKLPCILCIETILSGISVRFRWSATFRWGRTFKITWCRTVLSSTRHIRWPSLRQRRRTWCPRGPTACLEQVWPQKAQLVGVEVPIVLRRNASANSVNDMWPNAGQSRTCHFTQCFSQTIYI